MPKTFFASVFLYFNIYQNGNDVTYLLIILGTTGVPDGLKSVFMFLISLLIYNGSNNN